MKSIATAVCCLFTFAAAAEEPVHLAVPGFQVVNVDPKFQEFFTEEIAEQLSRRGLKVVTAREIAALMGMERQKELVGCAETASSCMAEIGNALGADGIVLGSIAKIGNSRQVNIKIVDTDTGERVGTFTKRVDREEDVLDALEEAGEVLAKAANATLKRRQATPEVAATVTAPEAPATATTVTKTTGFSKGVALYPAIGAVVFAGAGTFFYFQAKSAHDQLVQPLNADGTNRISDAKSIEDAGGLAQTLSRVGFGAAGGAAVTAAVLWMLGSSNQEVVTSAVVTQSGAAVSLTVPF